MNLDYSEFGSQLFPGLTAIDFQVSSSLGKKLTDLFQTVFDYKNNIDYNKLGIAEDSALARRDERIRATYHFFKSQVTPKLLKIIKDETGIEVKKLCLYGGIGYEVYGYFAVSLAFDNICDAVTTLERITATGNDKFASNASLEEFASMAENFDKTTGKVRKPYFGKSRKLYIDELHIDVNCAFLSEDFTLNKLCESFNAGEIAAIIMHELGHALTTIEHAADMYVVTHMTKTIKHHIHSDKEGNRALTVMNDIIKHILPVCKGWTKKVLDNPEDTKSFQSTSKLLVGAIEGIQKYTQSEEYNHENWLFGTFAMMGNALIIAVSFLFSVLCMNYIFLYYGAIMELLRHCVVDTTYKGTKAGDSYTNYNNTFQLERWADEFVSRHGYGPQLTSGLNKLNDMFKYGLIAGGSCSAIVRNSTVFNCLAGVAAWLMDKLTLLSYLDPNGYENQYQRNLRVLENTYGFFRNIKDVPGPIIDQWCKSIEQIKAQVKYAKTLSDTDFGKGCYRLLRDIASPVQWVVLLRNGDVAYDIQKLENWLDSLANNSLHYRAQQLRR